LNYRYCIS